MMNSHYRITRFAFACALLTLSACVRPPLITPNQKPDFQPSISQGRARDCAALWHDELGRDIDPGAAHDCGTNTQHDIEFFRAQIEQQPEYAAYRARLEAEAAAAAAPADLPRLVAHGRVFAQADGGRLTIAQADCFPCYRMFLDGGADALIPILQQLACLDPPLCAHAFNMLRTFGMYNNPQAAGGLGQFLVAAYGDRYYTELPAYHALLARFGLYDEFTVFADATTAMPDPVAQRLHWNFTLAGLLQSSNTAVEAGNELNQPINFLSAADTLARPTGLLASHGSNGSQARPVEPFWDYLGFHTNGAKDEDTGVFDEQRKAGHNCWEIANGHQPCLTNEISRVTTPGQGIWARSTPTDQHPESLAFDMGRSSALFNAGINFHSEAGKYGQLLDANMVSIAIAMISGLQSFGDHLAACQDANPYQHGDKEIQEEQARGLLRVYQFGSDPACHVGIH